MKAAKPAVKAPKATKPTVKAAAKPKITKKKPLRDIDENADDSFMDVCRDENSAVLDDDEPGPSKERVPVRAPMDGKTASEHYKKVSTILITSEFGVFTWPSSHQGNTFSRDPIHTSEVFNTLPSLCGYMTQRPRE